MEHELPTQVDPTVVSWLRDGGEMGALIRALDWSQTPIGPITSWSQSLRMMVRFLLSNRFPLLLWWGPHFCQLYNDAYRPVLGTKHPQSMGQPASVCWAEIWHIIGPLIETPYHGGPATWMEDLALEINRYGFVEETHFTVAYSPVPDETVPGGIGGVLATVHEISDKVVGERRVAVLRDLGARAPEAKTAEVACAIAATTLAQHPQDIPFALLYLLEADGQRARLAGAAGVPMGTPASPLVIELTGDTGTGDVWPLAEAVRTEAVQIIDDLGARCSPIPPGPWSDPPRVAAVMPIRSNMAHQLAGLLVAGISVRLRFDELYHSFLDLVTTQIATSIANARAYEEERKRAEALAVLDRAKTAFFSNVSHEFRTPLTLMLGPLEQALSAGDGALDAPQRAELEVVHRNGLRLLKLVNTLLDFARIEAGRIDASYAPTDLAACTIDLASVFRSAIERAGLRLVVDCPLLPEAVYVDRDMWEKIVLNLLSNAFKFTFAGEIAVRLAWGGDHVALAVRDTGTGIPAHELPHIFERFHRIRDARARTYEGTGIGLALVQELVRLHGGQITVTSAVDVGTTFTVTIPTGTAHLPADRLSVARTLAPTALGAAPYVEEALRWLPGAPERQSNMDVPFPLVPASPLPSAPTRARILLADDNADMRAYVQRLLSPYWEVDAVADGTQALAKASERLPDLVLADVMMPGLDGFALLRALRADPRTATIPVLLLSARAGEESRVEGLEAGADDYLVKPFSARELLARVESHLKMARFRHEADAAIRESERRLSTLISSLPGMAYRCRNDRQWTMEFVSDRVTDITGYTPDDFTSGRIHWVHLRHPDDVEWTWEAVQSAAREQRSFQFEYRIRHKDGAERWIWEQGRVVLDGAGQPAACEGFVTDITESKQAEEALRQSHVELHLHIDEIARFNRLAVGREMRMIELKQEVNALREQHGESARYPLDFAPAEAEPSSVSRLPGEEGDGLVPLEAILCTEVLHQRPKRAPAYEVEARALAALVQALADSPRTILQALAEQVLEVLQADSVVISLLTKDARRFSWAAIAGLWQPHLGGGTPRDFGPCGDVLDRNAPLLFSHWERRYPYLLSAMPVVEEGLLVPFYVDGRAVGTIWAIAHDDRRKFDAEDLRLLESLGRFASAAYQAVESLGASDERRAALSLMEDAVQARQLAEALNRQLRSEAAERQQAAEAVRAREAQLQALFEATPLGVYLVDADFRLRQVNPAALPVFGDIPDLIGRDFDEVIHRLWSKEYADEIVRHFRHTLETGEPYMTPERIEERRDRGVTEYYEWQIHRIPLPDGRYGVVCHFRDISAQVSARQVIVASEARYRQLAATLEQRVAERTALLALIQDITRGANEAVSSAEALQYAVDRLCAYTGWPVGHVYLAVAPGAARWIPTACWHLDDPARFAVFQQATQALEVVASENLIGQVGRGQPAWLLEVATDPAFQRRRAAQAAGLRTGMAWPLLIGAEVAGVLEFYTTEALPPNPALLEVMTQIGTQLGRVVERERSMEQAQRQQEALLQREKLAAMSTMLASVAHELNNPLASIGLQAEILRDDVRDGPLAEPVAEIAQAAARCERLVRQFLTLARQHLPERSAVALNTLVAETVELLAYPFQVDNVAVHLRLDEQLPPLWGDAPQLQQVLLNLLTNAQQALRAAPGAREVSCTTRYDPAQQRITLVVADTGPGIPLALQERIFEPFFTTKPPGVGTGLGLPLCRGIIEAHGGTLEVSSAPGHGATFRLTLPLGAVPALTPAPSQADEEEEVRRCAILVIDDEPSLARGLARLLRRDGHSVDMAADGRQALAQIETRAYDCILCDVRMPELDGPSLYRLLERQQPHLCQRLIFLTGDTLEPATQAFLEASGAPCLLKPFAIAEARRVIQRTLQAAGPAAPGTRLT